MYLNLLVFLAVGSHAASQDNVQDTEDMPTCSRGVQYPPQASQTTSHEHSAAPEWLPQPVQMNLTSLHLQNKVKANSIEGS
jgi:hypothetical protein